MSNLNSRKCRRRLCALAIACSIPLLARPASAITFNDAIGDNYGPSYVDIASVDVTSDATNLTFQINLNPAANLLASDGSQIYGKYQIGLQTGNAGNTAASSPFGNPIGISSGTGMDYWIGSWADNSPTPPLSGGASVYQYDGSNPTLVAGVGTNSPYIDVPVTLAATSTTITVPLASLGLATGDSFKFDVWSTFGQPGGQSAYDALGKATLTTDPGTPYSPVTPYDSGTNLLTYTVGGATTVSAMWTATGGGDWSTASNWTGGVPNGLGHTATFGGSITAPSTINIDGAKTLGTLSFNSANAYTLAGNTITLDVATGAAAINVHAGSHTISAAIVANDDVTLTVTPAASTLTLNGFNTTGHVVTKAGAGKVVLPQVRAARLDVQAGVVQTPVPLVAVVGAGTSVVSTLSIASGATFDITGNGLILDYDTVGTLPADVRLMLQSGRLIGSGAPAGTAIGYVDNAVGTAKTTFAGVNVDTTSLLIQRTLPGDADLSRNVSFADLVLLAQNYNTLTNATWQRGDFNYDGAVGFADLVLLAQHYNATAPNLSGFSDSFAADWALARSLVPEPTLVAAIAAVVVPLRRVRRGGGR